MSESFTTRYAVLFHDGVAEPHFDFLIDLNEASLATWRSPAWPIFETVDLVRLRDHRRVYLEYEGQIGGGRGFARRVDTGKCEIHKNAVNEIELTVDGVRLILRQVDGDQWVAIRGDVEG